MSFGRRSVPVAHDWWGKIARPKRQSKITKLFFKDYLIQGFGLDPGSLAYRIVFKERIYKIWKQFTTSEEHRNGAERLCSKNEYTKSESNSQQVRSTAMERSDCVQRTNIQNLKAIHNRNRIRIADNKIVFKERIYKIWKQFTTNSWSALFNWFQLSEPGTARSSAVRVAVIWCLSSFIVLLVRGTVSWRDLNSDWHFFSEAR